MLGLRTPGDGLPSHPGRVEILLAASCDRNRDKLWPSERLGSYADFAIWMLLLGSYCSCIQQFSQLFLFYVRFKEKRGLALDGKLKHEDTNLASSTM